jgi:hypothetical protein
VAFLPAETLDLCHGNTLYADFRQGRPDVVELEGFDDGDDHFHAKSTPIFAKDAVKSREMHPILLHYSMEPPAFIRYKTGRRLAPAAILIKRRCGSFGTRTGGISHRRGSWLACRREMLLKR